MKRTLALALSCVSLVAVSAGATEIRWVPVPSIGSGPIDVIAEYSRDKGSSIKNVDVTYIQENVAGGNLPVAHQQVYIGPSTSTTYPLLEITPQAPGLIKLEAQDGLSADEVSMEAGGKTGGTGWELPLLTSSTVFGAGKSAYVLNLTKTPNGVSNLSLFNFGTSTATCSVKVLRPKGSVIESRSGISVPAIGATRLDDVLRLVTTNAAGITAVVTCNQPFYSLGAFPNSDRTQVKVFYPVDKLPTAGTSVTMVNQPGTFLNCLPDFSFQRFTLPFEMAPSGHGPGTRYKTVQIDFDVRTGDPEYVVIRNIVGMLRSGGRRFGKTLFFGSFDRPQAGGGPKMLVDLGTPYIETVVKRGADLTGLQSLHFHIELNADQHAMLYQISRTGSGSFLFNVTTGFFNDDLNAVDANQPVLEFGLPGVADNAYFPPYRWKFANLKVVATK